MKPQYFDVHTHVNFDVYKGDREDVVKRAHESGVWMSVIGTDNETSESAVLLANKYDEGVYATVGIHPTHSNDSDVDIVLLKELAQNRKVVAIGECGLDYFRLSEDTKIIQKEVFIKQIELANELNKPLMVHIRDAYEDAILILKEYARVPSDIHFFAGDWEIAKKFLDLGSTLSFTGVLTFTNDYDEVVRNVPKNRIMSETDAPYVSPVPYRGKRNEPLYVKETVKKIAEIRGEDFEEMRGVLVNNALNFFGVKC